MERAELWTGEVAERGGGRRRIAAESVSTIDETASVVFRGVPRMPEHVSISWAGAQILSVADIDSRTSKLSYNPGRLEWEEETRTLYFLANRTELSAVCDHRDPEADKLAADP